ncbi:uncharacterized protein EMH_0079250 [Eimeria mitis]|uniref:Uncharacterized protein n=1 Tax=Eimeria mitis TaxID=44415 RepID=U6KEI8_9EIME|nr:uncharacterized protein EMH_0079250 [Eimeria mitis]CDJ36334.1 hypothetical protein EMH_0079250 [Eimeria mitis]
MSVKRKEIDGASGERRMKLPRVEVPMQETPLGPPPSPLDPDVDLLVDSMLPGCEDELTENFWLFDDDSTCLELQSGRAALTEEFVGQQSLPPRTQTDQSSPGLSADLSTVDGSDSASTTLLTSLESVLSESSFTSPGLSPEDWLSSSDAEAVGEALGVTAFTGMPYELLDILENSKAAKRYGWLSAAASDGRIDVEALSSSEASQSDSSSDVIQIIRTPKQQVCRSPPFFEAYCHQPTAEVT